MTIEQILDYVMYNPANTNRAVLRSFLKALVEPKPDPDAPIEVTNIEEMIEALDSEKKEISIKLVHDISLTEPFEIPEGKNVLLDLNGQTINCQAKAITVDGAELTIEGEGTITSTARPLLLQNGANVTLNEGTIVSTRDCAIDVSSNSTFTMNGGQVEAQEVAVLATYGGTVIINDGYLTTTDNFVVGGNGNSGWGDTTIIINGGRLEGNITSAGYVACGIYHPQDGTLIINGGEIVGNNGCGVLMRAGDLVVNNGTIIGTGDPALLGKVGDSSVVVGPNGIIYDQSSHYPDNQNLNVSVLGGYIVGTNHSIDVLADEGHEASVSVSGGTLIPAVDEDEVVIYDGGGVNGH